MVQGENKTRQGRLNMGKKAMPYSIDILKYFYGLTDIEVKEGYYDEVLKVDLLDKSSGKTIQVRTGAKWDNLVYTNVTIRGSLDVEGSEYDVFLGDDGPDLFLSGHTAKDDDTKVAFHILICLKEFRKKVNASELDGEQKWSWDEVSQSYKPFMRFDIYDLEKAGCIIGWSTDFDMEIISLYKKLETLEAGPEQEAVKAEIGRLIGIKKDTKRKLKPVKTGYKEFDVQTHLEVSDSGTGVDEVHVDKFYPPAEQEDNTPKQQDLF